MISKEKIIIGEKRDKKHEEWIDNVKIFACIFVVLGHFFQSMTKYGVLPQSSLDYWFQRTIDVFHVQLFFICSGYLYQKFSKVTYVGEWLRNVRKKFITLGIPYSIFTIVTLVIKTMCNSSTSNPVNGFVYTLFCHPTAPYWFLYLLFFMFLITPTMKTKNQAYSFTVVAVVFQCVAFSSYVYNSVPYVVFGILNRSIWFILGMDIAYFDLKSKFKRNKSIIYGVLFLILSILVCKYNIFFIGQEFILGCIACYSVLGIMYTSFNRELKNLLYRLLKEYTLPIFLMHAIFAAGLRLTFMKIGVLNPVINVVSGIVISFLGPIEAAKLMKKTKYLEVIIYPKKFIKL